MANSTVRARPDTADAALAALLAYLEDCGYRFVTPTPATHCRVIGRPGVAVARDLRDALGWSLPFEPTLLPGPLLDLLIGAGWCSAGSGLLRLKVRVSSIGDRLFLHSAFPTDEKDAVFLGPDSCRFVDFIRAELIRAPGSRRLVDVGAGAGVGAIMAAPLLPAARLTLTDINPLALRFARINAAHAGVDIETVEGDGLKGVSGLVDLVIANPPFIIDEEDRAYRNGGGMHGAELSLRWALAALDRLEPGGRLLLYTGSAIVAGEDALRTALEEAALRRGASIRYREIDPDIFGEELERPSYRDVERIAAIGAVIQL